MANVAKAVKIAVEAYKERKMTTPFLTQSEINEIAAPLTQPRAISRWFSRNGFHFKPRPNGMPLVSRAHYEEVMSGKSTQTTITKPIAQVEQNPDLTNFLNQFKTKRKIAQTA